MVVTITKRQIDSGSTVLRPTPRTTSSNVKAPQLSQPQMVSNPVKVTTNGMRTSSVVTKGTQPTAPGTKAVTAVVSMSTSPGRAANILYANVKAKDLEDKRGTSKLNTASRIDALNYKNSSGSVKTYTKPVAEKGTSTKGSQKSSQTTTLQQDGGGSTNGEATLSNLDCDTLALARSYGDVDHFAAQFGYQTQEAITVLVASWQRCQRQLQEQFLNVSPSTRDLRISNAEEAFRQFVASSGYSSLLDTYNNIIDSRFTDYGYPIYYGANELEMPAHEADILALVLGLRLDMSAYVLLGGDLNIELQFMPWNLQPEYIGNRYAFNIAINPSVEVVTGLGTGVNVGGILGLVESEQFATSGGISEQYGVGGGLGFGPDLEADILTPVGGRGGILFVGGGAGFASPVTTYFATGTSISIWDIFK